MRRQDLNRGVDANLQGRSAAALHVGWRRVGLWRLRDVHDRVAARQGRCQGARHASKQSEVALSVAVALAQAQGRQAIVSGAVAGRAARNRRPAWVFLPSCCSLRLRSAAGALARPPSCAALLPDDALLVYCRSSTADLQSLDTYRYRAVQLYRIVATDPCPGQFLCVATTVLCRSWRCLAMLLRARY
jgi:hypothetical protein